MKLMFKVGGKTVKTTNPIKGRCPHNCDYGYCHIGRTKNLYQGKLWLDLKTIWKSMDRDNPKHKMFGRNKVIFVCSMNDMFAKDIPDKWIATILEWLSCQHESNTFYFLTKNPERYLAKGIQALLSCFDSEYYLGATIESDIDAIAGKHTLAPSPSKRIEVMKQLKDVNKFISIEPIMEFSCSFAERIKGIEPEFIYVGMNNHLSNCHLLEPSLSSTKYLISQLKLFTEVREKTIREAVT